MESDKRSPTGGEFTIVKSPETFCSQSRNYPFPKRKLFPERYIMQDTFLPEIH